MSKKNAFTEEEKQFIIKNKSDMFYNQIASILNRSQAGVRRFCQKIEQEEENEKED